MYILEHKIPKYLYKFRDAIYKDYIGWLQSNHKRMTDNKLNLSKKAVNCFVLNLNNKLLAGKDNVGVTLNQTTFSQSRIINGKDTKRKVSYTYTKSLLRFLELYDYGTLNVGGEVLDYAMVAGKWSPTDFTTSYFQIGVKTKDLYRQLVKPRNSFDLLEDVIIVRDKGSKLSKTFDLDEKVFPILDFTNRYNYFSLGKNVTFKGEKLDIQIYKIFNVDFDNGGRSHHNCDYQRKSSKDRKEVEIEGSPIVCYDFKGFEPSIAYSMQQEIMDMDDPYFIQSIVDQGYAEDVARKLAKAVFIICLNVDSESKAKLAINKAISENMNVSELYEQGKIPTNTIPVKWLIDQVREAHYMINNMFFTSKGLQVQNVGSAINDYILDHMMQEYKQLVIQVHDDFSIAEEYEDVLKEVMHKAYIHVLGFDDNCKIEKEY